MQVREHPREREHPVRVRGLRESFTIAPPEVEEAMKQIHIGSRVRIADRAALRAALGGPAAGRPEPGQMLWAGREGKVSGYRRGAKGRSLYLLGDAPGLWPEEWIDPC